MRNYELPPVDGREATRYMGVRGDAQESVSALVERASAELAASLTPRVCFTEVDASVDGELVRLGGLRVRSPSLAARLAGCSSAVIFAATVGQAPDRLIARYSRTQPSLALAVSAVGSERVEALCDALCEELRAENATRGRLTVPRFSPGYGDLELSVQRELFDLLSPHRRIGVMLGESLIMSPSKSVSAIVGIKPRKDEL